MQISLHLAMVIEDKMREAGIDPDKEPEAPITLDSPANFAEFFGQ